MLKTIICQPLDTGTKIRSHESKAAPASTRTPAPQGKLPLRFNVARPGLVSADYLVRDQTKNESRICQNASESAAGAGFITYIP